MKQLVDYKIILQNSVFAMVIISTVSFSSAWAYTPPIGIPDPGVWGTTHPIDGVAPNTATKCPGWPSTDTSGCYYIDNTHAQATDTGNPYGYPDKPRKTLSSGNNSSGTYAAGSYIEMHGGPYTATNQWLIMQGTAENPVWWRGTPSSMPTLQGNYVLKDASYLFIEYLDFNGGNGGCVSILAQDHGNNIVIRNSKFRNRTFVSNTSALGNNTSQGKTTHDLVFYNNEFSELGTWNTEIDQDFHGIGINTYGRTSPTEVYKIWVLNNLFYHVSGNGVQVIASSEAMIPQLHHVYMGKNVGHANRQAPFWSKQASDVIISQNTMYDNKDHGPQPGTGAGCQYAPSNLWIIFNRIYDSGFGIRQSDTTYGSGTGLYFIGNIIYDLKNESVYSPTDYYREGVGITLWSGVQNRYIIDNTIYNVNGGVNSVQAGPVDMAGNVIANINSNDYDIVAANSYSVFKANKNFFSSAGKFRWNGVSYTSLAAFKTSVGQCADCWTGDPLFMDAVNHDFRPQAGSPLIGKGSRHGVYDVFQARYGVDIAYDFNGNYRPSGAWTLGAFEGGTPSTPIPVINKISPKIK